MKQKVNLLFIILLFIGFDVYSQTIKLLTSFEKNVENGTRYVAVLSDNSIWWYAPNSPWKKTATDGLPNGYNIKFIAAFEKNTENGTRYVASLSDNSIWWYAPNGGWKKSSMDGLPINGKQ